jgi:hypothetical protein
MEWTRAITVAVGDPITARQARSVSRAGNDRILSGLGDGAYRIAMGEFNGHRQPRNPADDQGLIFPSQAESFEVYHHVEPENGYQWPQAGPGEQEGANLGNPLNQFVFGNPALFNEENRLTFGFDSDGIPSGVPMWPGTQPPSTPEQIWEVAKMQRGVIEPESFLQSVPALEAAQSFFQIATPYYSPMGKSYGGFFPSPVELLSSCGTTEETGLGIQSFEIKFTAKRTDVSTAGFHGSLSTNSDGLAVITYAGSCPLGTDETTTGHVIAMARFPFATYVAVNDGAGGYNVDRFSEDDWIEGPYEGVALLDHDDGQQVARAVWRFCVDFRGSPAQRTPDDFEIEKIAFDFQAFSERQYYLAPARGRFEGDQLIADYPLAFLAGHASAGEFLKFSPNDATSYAINEGFVLGGFFVKADALASSLVQIEVLDGEEIIARLDITANEIGEATGIVYLDDPYRVEELRVRVKNEVQFRTSGGVIKFEGAELLAYKPNFWDCYLLLRMSATKGGSPEGQGVDGRGYDYEQALEIWESYAQYGCILNSISPGPRQTPEWINDNPVYDAARRFTRDHVRILGRRQFLSYEVTGGKSVLRFYRYVSYPGIPADTLDCFKGIAPPNTPESSGSLIIGETYIVRATSGTITHHGASFGNGQTFVALDTDFQEHEDAKLFIYNGIRATALPKSWSNRFCMFLQTKCYHPSESSIWKKEAYADYFAWNQRCHFYSGSATSARFRRHVTYNYGVEVTARDDATGYDPRQLAMSTQAQYIAPEAPSGYNYALNANISGSSQDFFKSCQIYQAPYEIESATIELDGLGREIVKLVFNRRFDSHEDAPATVNPDPMAWSGGEVTALQGESYRTDDNAIREFARHQADPSYHCTFKTGDSGTNSGVAFTPDNPFGSCYPHFFFVHLLPEPFEDDNEISEPEDTRATIDLLLQAETYIRYMCEGFIDDRTSMEITCKTGEGSLYDYRFKNLCFDAFQGTSIGAFALSVRPDNPSGFGAQPNTWMYADVFNRCAQCLNLMTRARVYLPFVVECSSQTYGDEVPVSPSWFVSGSETCSPDGPYKVAYTGAPPSANTVTNAWSDWGDCGGVAVASATSGINLFNCPGGGTSSQFLLHTDRSETRWRVNIPTDAIYAIPAAWRSLLESIGGFIGHRDTIKCAATAQETTDINDSEGCCHTFQQPCPGFFFDGTTGWKNMGCQEYVNTSECVMLDAGTLSPETPSAGTFMAGHTVEADPVRCGNISSVSIDVQVYTEPGFYVAIPLIDLP